MKNRDMNTIRCATILAAGALSLSALAGGPLNVNPADPDGVERWPNGGVGIPFNPDGAPAGGVSANALGPFTYEEAVAQTEEAFARWQAIPSATATYSNNGALPFDVDVTNYAPFVDNLFFGGSTPDGLSPIVYDADGSIFLDLFGDSGVLGFASTDTRDADGNPIEAVAFLNGGSILGGFPADDFLGVIFHEFGHYSGLGHTVVNGQSVALGDASGPSPNDTYGPSPADQIETMYPFAVIGGGQVTPHADDIGFYSFLYPAATYFADSGTITGTILDPTGTDGLTGVNVIARNIEEPFVDAVSAISGDRGEPGVYTINGLTPGAQYTVHIDQILQGGFSTTPIGLPGPEEFYNGPGESNNVTIADDPAAFVPVATAAGLPSSGIDIIFNAPRPGDPLGLGDDDSVELFLPFPVALCGQEFSSVFVNSNGSITFGAGDTFFLESSAGFLTGPPRIAGLWDDLDPTAGGIVTFFDNGNQFKVVFDGVPEFGELDGNSFEITLFKSPFSNRGNSDHPRLIGNRFAINYGTLSAEDGLTGLSCGGAVTSTFEPETDFSGERRVIWAAGSSAIYEQFAGGDDAADLDHKWFKYLPTTAFFDRFENNDSVDDAKRVHLPFDTIGNFNFSKIEPVGNDVDFYRFNADAGTTLVAEVLAGQIDSTMALYRLTELPCERKRRGWWDWRNDCRWNPQFDAELIAIDDDGGAGVLSRIVFPIDEEGSYAIAVSTFPDLEFTGGGNSEGRFVLSLETIDGFLLNLGDDDSFELDLGFSFPFQGESYTSVFVNSNGNLTFGQGNTDFSESVVDLLNGPPRIAALFDDLSPNVGGLVIVDGDESSFSVTFDSVPEFFASTPNTFTVTLDASGDVNVTYGVISAIDGLAGISEGGGAIDPGATDLSAAGSLPVTGTVYEQFDFANTNDLANAVLDYVNP